MESGANSTTMSQPSTTTTTTASPATTTTTSPSQPAQPPPPPPSYNAEMALRCLSIYQLEEIIQRRMAVSGYVVEFFSLKTKD
jgi:hypothetical protein